MLNSVRRLPYWVLFWLSLGSASCSSLKQATEADLAITNVTVIDTEISDLKANQTVLIKSGEIIAVGPANETFFTSAQTVDGTDKFLIPGLIDMHTHIDPQGLSAYLLNGVTTIRDMGTQTSDFDRGLFAARNAINRGEQIGPQVITPGWILDGDVERNPRFAPHFRQIATVEDGKNHVDALADEGVDFIKVYSNLSPEVFAAIAQQARQRGLPFAGHVPHRVGTRRAVDQGMQTLEHLRGFLTDASANEASLRAAISEAIMTRDPSAGYNAYAGATQQLLDSYDAEKARDLYDAIVSSGAAVVPTLVVLYDPRWKNPAAAPDPQRVAQFSPIYQRIVSPWGGPEGAYASVDEAVRLFEFHQQIVKDMSDHGIDILVGTDSANSFVLPGYSIHQELELLVDAGLTPGQVLRAATFLPARYLSLSDKIGAIRPGMEADLVLLDQNPLQRISATKSIDMVVLNGRPFTSDELQALRREKQQR